MRHFIQAGLSATKRRVGSGAGCSRIPSGMTTGFEV